MTSITSCPTTTVPSDTRLSLRERHTPCTVPQDIEHRAAAVFRLSTHPLCRCALTWSHGIEGIAVGVNGVVDWLEGHLAPGLCCSQQHELALIAHPELESKLAFCQFQHLAQCSPRAALPGEVCAESRAQDSLACPMHHGEHMLPSVADESRIQ